MTLLTPVISLVSVLPAGEATLPSPLDARMPDPLTAAVLAPVQAQVPARSTSKFSYTYGQLDYLHADFDDAHGDSDGVVVTASVNITDGFYAQTSYADASGGGADSERFRIGGGYHLSINERLDLYGLLSFEHDHVKIGGASDSDDGLEFDGGLRYMLAEKLEVDGQFEWNYINDGNFGVLLGARYYIIDPLSIGLTTEWIDDDFRLTLGARYQF